MKSRALRRTSFAAVLLLSLSASTPSDSPVADAAQRGDLDVVRELLRSGADVNAAQGDGMTALHWAAERGDVELGEILLYAGANVAAGTRIGRYTPLHIAAREGREDFVRLVLTAGADPGATTTNSGTSPLHLAAASGVVGSVEALLRAGADVNVRAEAWGQTPLIFAAGNGRAAAIEVLLEAGADPSLTSYSVDVVERAEADDAAEQRLEEFLEAFREKEGGGADWRPAPAQVQAAIEAAREIQRNWPNVPDPDAPIPELEALTDSTGAADSAMAAADSSAVDDDAQVEDSSSAPADSTNAEEQNEAERPMSYAQMVGQWGGLTPLHHAVRQGYGDAVRVLLDGGAAIDQPTADLTTPLLMAAINGQFDLALELLDRGADPNGESLAGATPLYAVLERTWAPRASYAHPQEHQQQQATHLEVMEQLLEAGADPNVRLRAHLWYMEYTFGVLRGSGINLKGATPFWRAAYALDVDAMRLLKEHGADPTIPTIKPPERRRRPPSQEPEPDTVTTDTTVVADSAQAAGAAEEAVDAEAQTEEATSDEGAATNPKKANAEGESAEEDRPGADEDEDLSGVPPVPAGGPAIFPIHAASGVGYGQSFAGNAHRYVPGNWLAAVKFLVEECGADVNQRDHNAYTALHHAASRGDTEMVRYLVEQGADVMVLSRRGQTTADMANGPVQRVQPFPETLDLLVSLGAVNNDNCVSCE